MTFCAYVGSTDWYPRVFACQSHSHQLLGHLLELVVALGSSVILLGFGFCGCAAALRWSVLGVRSLLCGRLHKFSRSLLDFRVRGLTYSAAFPSRRHVAGRWKRAQVRSHCRLLRDAGRRDDALQRAGIVRQQLFGRGTSVGELVADHCMYIIDRTTSTRAPPHLHLIALDPFP